MTGTTRQFSGQGEAQLSSVTYDGATARPNGLIDYSAGAARSVTYTYDAAGRPSQTIRPSDTATTTYNSTYGRVSSISDTTPGGTVSNAAYTYSLAGKVKTDTNTPLGQTRAYTYDRAGRLTKTTDGAATRNYAYDANSNRCAQATNCNSPTYSYDNADRLTASPQAATYTYDAHGNLTGANVPPPGTGEINQNFNLDPSGNATTFGSFTVTRNGTFAANLNWTPASAYTPGTTSGSLPPNSGSPDNVSTLASAGYVDAAATWSSSTVTETGSGSLAPAASSFTPFNVNAPGPISLNVGWAPTTHTKSWKPALSGTTVSSSSFTVNADGDINVSGTWPPGRSGVLQLTDSVGNILRQGGPGVAGGLVTLQPYPAVVSGAYPQADTYYLKAYKTATSLGATIDVSATWQQYSDVNIALIKPNGQPGPSSSSTTAKPETLTYDVPANSPSDLGAYQLKVTAGADAASWGASMTHQQFADVELMMTSPLGSRQARTTTGTAKLGRQLPAGAWGVKLFNYSTFPVPSYTLNWSSTLQSAPQTSSGSLSGNASIPLSLTATADGNVSAEATWNSSTVTQTDSGTLTGPSSTTRLISINAPGPLNVSVDWAKTSRSQTWSPSVARNKNSAYGFNVSASGPINASATFPAGTSGTLELLGPGGGAPLQSKTSGAAGGAVVLPVTNAPSPGVYPATAGYSLRVTNNGLTTGTIPVSFSYPVTANLKTELLRPDGSVAVPLSSTSVKPQTLSYAVPSGPPTALGNYTLRVVTADFDTAWSSTASFQQFADMRLVVTDGTNSGVGQTATGATSAVWRVPASATLPKSFTATLTNMSSFAAPVYSLSAGAPATLPVATTLTVSNAVTGATVVADYSAAKPKTVSAPVTPGSYQVRVTSTGPGTATLTGSYPAPQPLETIAYDGGDHATVINNQNSTVTETLAPSGRVLVRKVTDNATLAVTEHTVFGYAGPGDSPSYTKDVPTGVITTYVLGPSGLVLTDIGGTPTYPVSNGHGDIVGTIATGGAFTAVPAQTNSAPPHRRRHGLAGSAGSSDTPPTPPSVSYVWASVCTIPSSDASSKPIP